MTLFEAKVLATATIRRLDELLNKNNYGNIDTTMHMWGCAALLDKYADELIQNKGD